MLLGYGVSVLSATIILFYLAYTRYEDPADPRFSRVPDEAGGPPLPTVPSVTLLVAVKDEREVIDRCVRSMVGSDYPDLQIVVVDDGSEDGTAERLAELSDQLGITLLALEQNVGKKHALVRGAGSRPARSSPSPTPTASWRRTPCGAASPRSSPTPGWGRSPGTRAPSTPTRPCSPRSRTRGTRARSG